MQSSHLLLGLLAISTLQVSRALETGHKKPHHESSSSGSETSTEIDNDNLYFYFKGRAYAVQATALPAGMGGTELVPVEYEDDASSTKTATKTVTKTKTKTVTETKTMTKTMTKTVTTTSKPTTPAGHSSKPRHHSRHHDSESSDSSESSELPENLGLGEEEQESAPAAHGSLVPSKSEFIEAVTRNGYPAPTDAQYKSFVKGLTSKTFSTKREVAMFLAQLLHESGGLRYKIEERCINSHCPGEYVSPGDKPNKHYYGRGYIQLSWSYNYRAASIAIFGDANVLLDDPDRVASDEDLSWGTAFWYWREKVHTDKGVLNGQFGSSTMRINGALECGRGAWIPEKRFKYYTEVLKAFGIKETPNPDGC